MMNYTHITSLIYIVLLLKLIHVASFLPRQVLAV